MTDYDSPWKEMLDGYFPDFMAFFFPEAGDDIDWARGYESLDKELQQIVRDAELGKRLADKLMKVWRRGRPGAAGADPHGDRRPPGGVTSMSTTTKSPRRCMVTPASTIITTGPAAAGTWRGSPRQR